MRKHFLIAACCAGPVWATGSAPPPAQLPAPTAAAALRMNVADPTYAEGSGQLALFKGVNTLRQKFGVGLLAQDAALDTAAQAHAVYLNAHSVAHA